MLQVGSPDIIVRHHVNITASPQMSLLMQGGIMLQRYDIARNDQTNRLSIKEFAVLETKSRRRDNYEPIEKDYSLLHEVSYDGDIIRAAIREGQKALISELRSGDFFPIGSCAKIIAESVTGLFNGKTELSSEVYFDDRTLLSTFNAA
jgi:hypothetical protein